MDFDTDVSHYTDQEIRDLLELDELNYDDVVTSTQLLIDEHQDNPELVRFYNDIRERYENKDTTTKTIDAEVKKGTINPDLKNTVTRMINVDSSYRELSLGNMYDTDNYIFTLNEPVNNIISLMLYSIEIPQSWYTFTLAKGNTSFQPVFMVQTGTTTEKYEYPPVFIRDGNYTTKSLLNEVRNALFTQCGLFRFQLVGSLTQSDVFTLDQDVYTGKCKMSIKPDFLISNIFLPTGVPFVPDPNTECKIGFIFHSIELKTKINYNLGWLLGFRIPFLVIPETLTTAIRTITIEEYSASIIDTAGTKYIILKLDDYKANRLNKSLVCINTKVDQSIPLPSYYNKSLSQYQTSPTTLNVLASAPRQLTAKQIYTINSISNSRMVDITAQRVTSPDDSDIFAKIPVKKATEWGSVGSDGTYSALDNGPGKLIIEFSGPLQLNTRDYFGPVNMTSFAVSLYDDKGMILGLNGMDWSFTIIAKSIYQY
jgi:hypothetical protein